MTTYLFFGCLISGYGVPLRALERGAQFKAALRLNANLNPARAAYLAALAEL